MDIFYNYQSYLYLQQNPKKPTKNEILLAGALIKLGIDYQIQARISDTIVDGLITEFFAPAKIIIEVDGSYHNDRKQKMIDARRMVLHSHLGYHTIRVTNEEIEKDWIKAFISSWVTLPF